MWHERLGKPRLSKRAVRYSGEAFHCYLAWLGSGLKSCRLWLQKLLLFIKDHLKLFYQHDLLVGNF